MKLKVFIFFMLMVLLVVGCNDSQSADSSDLYNINYSAENDAERDILVGNNDSQHTDGLDLYNVISNSEEIETESEINGEDEVVVPEHIREFLAERAKNIVDFIISGSYTPADRDIDLHRIERFVFTYYR